MGIPGGIGGILCMVMPIQLKSGYFLDLRLVPLAICLLYGGYGAGGIAAALLLAFRLYLGGTGVSGSIVMVGCAFLGYAAVFRRFSSWASPTKIIAAVALSFWLSAVAFGYTWSFHPDIFHDRSHVTLYIQYMFIQSTATWIIAYFIELIIKNAAIRDIMEQSKKMQLVSELAASVSHEVRNPLTVTRGFIQLLKSNAIPEAKRADYIDLALEELDRAEAIISDFLNFAKPQLSHVETLTVMHEIRYVADIITPYATMNRVELILELDEACVIRGEKDKFRQCLLNLAKNAIEAMPAGGQLRVHLAREQDCVVIRLSDNGIGMTKEQVERLGTPYYSTKDKGTGLGTMVVYSMIQAMDGRIHVTSTVGAGTCFTLTFIAA